MTGNGTSEWALYLRKSKGRVGIARQRVTTTAHIEQLGGRIIAEFSDTDRTAFRKDGGEQPVREHFDEMIAMLRARPGLGVAAWHADRLTRNDTDTAELARVCRRIETRSGGSYDLSTANGRKRLRDDASDAIYEVDHNTERVAAQKAERAADGHWLGGRRPFGWQVINANPKKGIPPRLVLDEREAAAIAAGYAAVLARKSLYAVAREWNAAGITTTSGRPWKPSEVRRVLLRGTNPAPPPAQWPPLADAATHRAVAAILADAQRRTTPGPERKHLLSGIAICGLCGGGMVCSTIGPSRGKRAVYRCRASVEGSSGHVARDAAALEEFVGLVVVERLSRPDARALLLSQRESPLPALQAERDQLAAQMTASNDLRRAGLLTLQEFATERTEHKRQMEQLDQQIAAAGRADVLAPMIRDPAGVWEAAELGQRRAIVDALMSITVQPQKNGRPPGWKPGEPYFHADSVEIGWRR